MQCIHPITIRLPTGEPQQVSCGKCLYCQQRRQKDWLFRLKEENKRCKQSYVVTITYDDINLPPLTEFRVGDFEAKTLYYYHKLDNRDLQLFHKRLRKIINFRFFAVGEYGKKSLRPHYHIIYFFQSPIDKTKLLDYLFKTWQKGSQFYIDKVTDKSINYILKYNLKIYDDTNLLPKPQLICSKRPYIGYGFMTDEKISFFENKVTDISNNLGYKCRIPKIYRTKYLYELDDYKQNVENQYIEQIKKMNEEKLSSASQIGLSLYEYNQQAYNIKLERSKINNKSRNKQL